MSARITVPVMTAAGLVVELTLERCQAAQVDGERCCSREFRGADGRVLCWTHRQTIGRRRLVLFEDAALAIG